MTNIYLILTYDYKQPEHLAPAVFGGSNGRIGCMAGSAGLAASVYFFKNRNYSDSNFIFLGIFAAWKIARMKNRWRAVIDGILTLPMVLPPTACGFFLLMIFSRRRLVGRFLDTTFNTAVVQSFAGCVIAAVVIAFPLMYRNARAAFEQIDQNLIYAGRTLGMRESEIFWRVAVPAARPGILSGTVLTFARALGEYGATSMLAGIFRERRGQSRRKSQWSFRTAIMRQPVFGQ